MFRPAAALLLVAALAGCTHAPTDGKVDPTDDSGTVPTDTTDTTDTAVPFDPSATCADLGLPVLPFQDFAETTALNGGAADFTVETTEGSWNFKERWSGCDSYLFVQDEPEQATGWPEELWARDHKDLFAALPHNVELFFVSTLGTGAKRTEALDALKVEVDKALNRADEAEEAWWTPRVHYITTRHVGIDGWLGTLMGNPGWGIGINRAQTIRYIGSYGDPERYNADYGWFEPNLSMVANEAVYYNFEADREVALAAEGATVVPIITQLVGGNVPVTVDLPDAATMAGFDALTIDTRMGCGGVGEYGYCPAWDYMAYLYMTVVPLEEDNPYATTSCQPAVAAVDGHCAADGVATETACTDASTCEDGTGTVWTCEGYQAAIAAATVPGACRVSGGSLPDGTHTCNATGTGYDPVVCPTEIEVGRWITTYHREGRWVYDISAMLPFMVDGGSHGFRYETNGPYTIDVSLRFSNQGKAAVPTSSVYAFDGGEHDIPWTFEVPADVTRVELATIISQHGSDSEGCGEFCNIEHHFTVNANEAGEVLREFPEAGTGYQCQADAAIGTIPNQYGTWWYGRGGWCPGKEVPTVMADITDQVTIGGTNTIVYTRTRNGQNYSGGANVRMNSWVVLSR